jgi:hypothetical protein
MQSQFVITRVPRGLVVVPNARKAMEEIHDVSPSKAGINDLGPNFFGTSLWHSWDLME